MTFRPRSVVAIAVSALLVATMALPIAAYADSLSWPRAVSGPPNLPAPDPQSGPIPVAGAFSSVSFADATHGWAVGKRVDDVAPQVADSGQTGGFIAHTTNGGSDWTSATVGPNGLNAVVALADSDVWAVGDGGEVRHWDGTTWAQRSLPAAWNGRPLYALAFADAQSGWAVGYRGGVVRTTDGGATWTVVVTPSTSTAAPSLRAITSVNATTCIAVGDAGVIRRITATGVTTVTSPTSVRLNGVTFTDALHGFAVGANSTLLTTTDGGMTWSARTLPVPPSGAVMPFKTTDLQCRAVAFADPLTGMIVGDYQSAWRTLDGGASWTASRVYYQTTAANDNELRGIAFPANNAAAPVAVGSAVLEQLADDYHKAWAYVGSWTGTLDPVVRSNAGSYPYYADSASITVSAMARPGAGDLATLTYRIDSNAAVTVPVSPGLTATSVALPKITGVGTHTIAFWCADATGHESLHLTEKLTILARPSSKGYPTTPALPSSITHGRSFTSTGYVTYHTAGTAPVTLYFDRYKSGRWVYYKSAAATVSTISVPGTDFSKYSRSTSVPYAGKWRVRAKHTVGGKALYSSYRTFTVK